MINMKKEFGPDYASIADVNFKTKYRANCYCNTVQYEVCSDPVDAKICHCLACQKLHGAPMQWAAIFHKHDVRITKGIAHLQLSYCQMLCMRRLGGVPNFLNTIDEFYTSNYFT